MRNGKVHEIEEVLQLSVGNELSEGGDEGRNLIV